jgi:F-type H+-transporting ATPase subunit a
MEIHISIAPEMLFTVGPVQVTNSMFTMFLVMAFLIIVGAAIARSAKMVPGRWQSLFEVVAQFILDLVESTGGKQMGRRLFPLIGGVFIFIAIANYTGVLPGVGTIGFYRPVETTQQAAPAAASGQEITVAEPSAEEAAGHGELVPLFRPPNSDINMTLALALLTFTLVQVVGIRTQGVAGRIKHMADPWFIFPIEVVSELGRIVSLSARLFGNVFAGEVLLAVMYALANAVKIAIVPLFVPVIFIFLELLFGTIQALVFALLTAIYITLAAAGHDDHEEHAAGAGHGAEPARPAPATAGD